MVAHRILETIACLCGTLGSRAGRGMANRSLCEAHKERRAQFVSRSGCSGGSLPGNNHDAGIRDLPETHHEHHVGLKQARFSIA